MKTCLQLQQLFCSRENQLASRFIQQNEKSTPNIFFYTIGYFLQNRLNFDLEDKLLPVYNMASWGLKKMLDFIILYTHKRVSENMCSVILFLDTNNKWYVIS